MEDAGSVLEYVTVVELDLLGTKFLDDAGVFRGGRTVEVTVPVAGEILDALVVVEILMLNDDLTLDGVDCSPDEYDASLLEEVAVDFLEEEEDVTGTCAKNPGAKFDVAGIDKVGEVIIESTRESQ